MIDTASAVDPTHDHHGREMPVVADRHRPAGAGRSVHRLGVQTERDAARASIG